MRSHERRPLGIITTIVTIAAAVLALAAEPAVPRFALAVMRRDGRLVPFASFEDGKWRNRWPTIFRAGDEIPLTVKDIPSAYWPWKEPLLAWKVWPLDAAPRAVNVTGPVLFDSECSRVLGLTTSYQPFPALLPKFNDPFPKDGLATAGDVTVEPIETLTSESPAWAIVEQAVRDEVTNSEEASVREWAAATKWTHPYSTLMRLTTPLQLEVLCRGLNRRSHNYVFYFEGVKTYKPAAGSSLPAGCNILTFFTGWLEVTPGTRGNAMVTTDITNCAREGLAYTVPFGQITVDGHTSWVLQVSGRGYEHYEVVEPGADKVTRALATVGGTCR